MLEVKFCKTKDLSEDKLLQLYTTARNYLYQSPRGKVIFEALESDPHKTVLHVNPAIDSTFQHDPKQGNFDAYWNPIKMLKLDGKNSQSPALGLLHELGHGLQCQEALAEYERRSNDVDYLEIEDDNLKHNETVVAKEKGEPFREKYRDFMGANYFVGNRFKNMDVCKLVVFFEKQ